METEIVEAIPAALPTPTFNPNVYIAAGALIGVATGLTILGVMKWRKNKQAQADAENQTTE